MTHLARLYARLLFAAMCAGLGCAADHTYTLSGNAADVRPEKTEGALLLMGGGDDVDAAFHWFVAKAGGGDIVVLQTSDANRYSDYLFSKIGGVDSVETILFQNRTASQDPRLLEIIRTAEGIWLAGADYNRAMGFWKDTPVAAALNAHVRAGKPLGGTESGLVVLGEFSFPGEPGKVI